MGVSKQRLPNPLSLPRMSPDVSRHLTESHVTLFRLPYRSLPFFLSFFFFFFLSYVFDSATIRIPSAIRNSCSCTLSNSGDPARFLSPISLFPQSTLPRISRHPPIFVFVIELNVRLFLFFLFCSFFIFLRSFSLFRSFSGLVL